MDPEENLETLSLPCKKIYCKIQAVIKVLGDLILHSQLPKYTLVQQEVQNHF